MKINAPFSFNDREKELFSKLTRRIPRIRIELPSKAEPPVVDDPVFTDEELDEYAKYRDAVKEKLSLLDKLTGRKKVYPY